MLIFYNVNNIVNIVFTCLSAGSSGDGITVESVPVSDVYSVSDFSIFAINIFKIYNDNYNDN